MSMIHVNRDGRALGQFPPEDVAERLANGDLLPTDLGWRDGMESWLPLSAFTDLPEPDLAVPPGPVAPLSPEAITTADPAPTEIPGTEPAWERREQIGVVAAVFETVRAVLFEPAATFRGLKKTGGYLEPLMFVYPLNIVCALVALFYQQAYLRFLPDEWLPKIGEETMKSDPASLIYVIPLMFISNLVQPFVLALLCHLGLVLVGGVKDGYETTFRVVCYFFGSFALIALIPFPPFVAVQIGLLGVVMVALVVYLTIGFREAHRVSVWASLFASLMPFIVCCACGLALAVGSAAFVAALKSAAQ